jgi:glycosyltransferase involved in cell wall biosynthesis
MKVLALVESAEHVCYRYRLEAFAWAMAQRGLFLKAQRLEKNVLGRLRQFAASRRADIVILQRKLLPHWQVAALRQFAKCLVYDLDDALFQRDSYSPKGPCSRQRLFRFREIVAAADAVLAGNDFLWAHAAVHTDPERVCVVPTCVQTTWYTPAAHCRTGSAARLVWIGQQSMLPSLQAAHEHLLAASRRTPQIELRLICDAAPPLPHVRTTLVPWSSATEALALSQADIGISWLPDDTWSLGKCGLKVLQYMAAGLPVVANPVGIHRRLVIDGETGFLASTPTQWAEAIARLAADPMLRRRLGTAGRILVESQYSVQHW